MGENKMFNKTTIILLLLFVSPVLATTEGDMLTFQKNETVDIKGLCLLSTGMACSGVEPCNLTVFYPNFTALVENVSMTFQTSGFYNYTLGQLNTTGDYKGAMTCTSGSTSKADDASFRIVLLITENNINSMGWESLALAAVAAGAILLYMSTKFEKRQFHMQILFLMFGLFSLVTGIVVAAQTATIDSQPAIAGNLAMLGNSFVWFIIVVLAIIFITFLWDKIKELSAAGQGRGEMS